MSEKVDAVQESIKLALDAADAATDVTSEYNNVRKQHAKLEAKVQQIHKYTTVVFVSSIISGLFVIIVSAFLFFQGSNKLTSMTETSREALVVFAENVDSVNKSLKNLNEAINKQGDLLEVNKKLVSTIKNVENKVSQTNQLTIGELAAISKSLIEELNNFSEKSNQNSIKLNSNLKSFSSESAKELSKVMKKMSQNPIYKKIIANQAIQAQQISNLIKSNNSLSKKMKNKASMIKYP